MSRGQKAGGQRSNGQKTCEKGPWCKSPGGIKLVYCMASYSYRRELKMSRLNYV